MNKAKKDKNNRVTLESNIMEVVQTVPGAVEIFAEYGLPCAGCIAASYESLGDIINEFGVDGEEFLKVLNDSLAKGAAVGKDEKRDEKKDEEEKLGNKNK